jgi:hypothetical protein
MEVVTAAPAQTIVDVQHSGLSLRAIVGGAIAATAVTLLLTALGAGLGLSSLSPWSNAGASATTFKVGSGVYLCCVAVMSSAFGGYLAARLRTRWIGIHNNEVFFRDTAHGFLAWAFATVLIAISLGGAVTHIVSGSLIGFGSDARQAGSTVNPARLYVDKLFRTDNPSAGMSGAQASNNQQSNDAMQAEVLRLWTADFSANNDLSAADKSYVARLVSARTGLSQADAEKRVNDVITEAKTAADKARRSAAQFSFWVTASLLLGAFAAALAAVEGGQLRDGTWTDRTLTPRAL